MTALYNSKAKKKATNLSVNSDLLKRAKELKINISNALETALIEIIKKQEIINWQKENKTSIDSYNNRVLDGGSFGDEMRNF